MVCSAALMVLASGALTTRTPALVAASRSMLSTPMPARPITRSRGAAEIISLSTLVADRTTRPSASASAASRSARSHPAASITSAEADSSSIPARASASATITFGFIA